MGVEPSSELPVVVDLAIEDDHASPGTGPHWLVAGPRQIHDGQTAMRESDSRLKVQPDPGIVGTAMHDCVRHLMDDR